MGRPRAGQDAGETLIEIVISLMMVGIMVSAVVLAVGEGAQLTGLHQQLVTTDVALKRGAEAVKNHSYISGKPGIALATDYQSVAAAAVPAGYTVTVSPPVRCAPKTTGPTYDARTATACTGAAAEGLQLIELTITSNATGTRTQQGTVVMKRKP